MASCLDPKGLAWCDLGDRVSAVTVDDTVVLKSSWPWWR
jgi:hypothetical protein